MDDDKKIQPSEGNQQRQQMTVGKVFFTPYQPKPLNVWLKEKQIKNENQ